MFERALQNYDGIATNIPELDIFDDLKHMPITLKRSVRENILVRKGYCEVFDIVLACLEGGTAPSSQVIDQKIRCSSGQTHDCARLFLRVGGQAKYALQYLITRIQESLRGQAESGLSFLPRCANDNKFEMVRERLLRDSLDSST